jgi:hypothetical protein
MRPLRDYCDGLANCATLEGVGDLFRETVAKEGYSSSACRVMAPAGNAPQVRVLFRNWPEDWAKLTEEWNFRFRNPVLAAALRRMEPFTWVDINDKRKKPATEQEIWNTASEWGWINGFVVPVHGPRRILLLREHGKQRIHSRSQRRTPCLSLPGRLARP